MKSSPQQETSRNRISPEKALGLVLRALREKSSLSQEALAYEADLHRTYIGQLERGEKSPSLKTVFAIAASLDAAPSEIIRNVERLASPR